MKKILFSTLITCLFVFNVNAQEEESPSKEELNNTYKEAQNKWQLRVRAIAVAPAPYFYDAIGGVEVDYSTAFAPEVDITYFMSRNMALELMLTSTKHDVEVNGEVDLGNVSLLPPTLSLQYHFFLGDFKPYVGAGINYTIFYGEDAGDLDDIEYKNEFGYAVQAGLDYNLNDKWFLNLDFKKMFLNTEITVNNDSANAVKANLDPLFFGFGVGMKF